MVKRLKIQINGIVQGVGYRPFLHRIAREFSLSGWCQNTVRGMEIEIQGEEECLEGFRLALVNNSPALSSIRKIDISETPPLKEESGFLIRKSDDRGDFRTLISPDTAICEDCKAELFNINDRRYRYPFINCTCCGPRFTIIKSLPYDRDKTSMSGFRMCRDCKEEYDNIDTRRYHAQPDCCEKCGPTVEFINGEDDTKAFGEGAITRAKELIRSGKILAIKGIGGYHLATPATNIESVNRLRRKKQRDERPFALMCKNSSIAEKYVYISDEERAILESQRAPIVLLKKKEGGLSQLSETDELGIMLPYTPLHMLLMEDFEMLVMTSMNLSDLPVICDEKRDIESWKTLADGIITHNRQIVNRCDDSLIRVIDNREYFIRRSRGYTPEPVIIEDDITGILGCGSEQKASFCLGRGDEAFLSQHIGDLKNEETYSYYRDQIERFKELFGIKVTSIVRDLHPDYLSSHYANERVGEDGISLTCVQHHHAHMASCMADNGIDGDVIGLIWDGTGLGTDGRIWGAECLVGGYSSFERAGSIKPIALPGGDICTKEIYRTATSLMLMADHEPEGGYDNNLRILIEKNINAPLSSGMGRLFDGVYSIVTGRRVVSYEGQAAVLLETLATETKGSYQLSYYNENGARILDTGKLIERICHDLKKGESDSIIAGKFHNAIIDMALEQCRYARDKYGLDRVVLSGGVFQNMRLLKGVTSLLKENGFKVFSHKRFSCNDEGIALGQVMICKRGGGSNVSGNAP